VFFSSINEIFGNILFEFGQVYLTLTEIDCQKLEMYMSLDFRQSLLPPSVLSGETEYIPFVTNILNTLSNLTNIDDRLRKSFKEFYANPNEQNGACGVSFKLLK
jgi:hypothetical protein